MDALTELAEFYTDPLRAAKAWKAAGGKVVGYLCDNVPDELIAAAGFFPLRVKGSPETDTSIVDERVDRLYTPDVTVRPPFIAALLARLLNGDYDILDYLIIPHNRDAIQAIFRQLKDAKRADPSLRLPVMHYLDKAWSPGAASEAYNRTSILNLKRALEQWAGEPLTPAALMGTIATANENRRSLQKLAALRASAKISGMEALQVIGSSMLMPKEDHNELLDQVLKDVAQRPARPGPRLFVGGSSIDHTGIYAAIEAAGATIVAEDHDWGGSITEMPLNEIADPFQTLAERFHRRAASSILFPITEGRRACAERAVKAKADAAVFYVMDQDWSQVWETPGQMKALEAEGVPCLHLRRQSYAGDENITPAVRAFLSQLPVKAHAS